jgi:hypothetical protein
MARCLPTCLHSPPILAPDAMPKALFGVFNEGDRAIDRRRLGDAFTALGRFPSRIALGYPVR